MFSTGLEEGFLKSLSLDDTRDHQECDVCDMDIDIDVTSEQILDDDIQNNLSPSVQDGEPYDEPHDEPHDEPPMPSPNLLSPTTLGAYMAIKPRLLLPPPPKQSKATTYDMEYDTSQMKLRNVSVLHNADLSLLLADHEEYVFDPLKKDYTQVEPVENALTKSYEYRLMSDKMKASTESHGNHASALGGRFNQQFSRDQPSFFQRPNQLGNQSTYPLHLHYSTNPLYQHPSTNPIHQHLSSNSQHQWGISSTYSHQSNPSPGSHFYKDLSYSSGYDPQFQGRNSPNGSFPGEIHHHHHYYLPEKNLDVLKDNRENNRSQQSIVNHQQEDFHSSNLVPYALPAPWKEGIHPHERYPYIVSSYFQLVFNAILSGYGLYVVFVVGKTMKSDIELLLAQQSQLVLAEIESCRRHYYENQCAPETAVPLLRQQCEYWYKCMQQNVNGQVVATSAQTLGLIFNLLVEPLSLKFISVLVLCIAVAFATNVLFGYVRAKMYWGDGDDKTKVE